VSASSEQSDHLQGQTTSVEGSPSAVADDKRHTNAVSVAFSQHLADILGPASAMLQSIHSLAHPDVRPPPLAARP
jgi:hypothetical protein